MKARLITGFCIGLTMAGLVFLNGYPIVISFLISAMSFIGVFEMLRCIGVHKKLSISIPLLFCGLVVPVSLFLYYNFYEKTFAESPGIVAMLVYLGVGLLLYMFAVAVFSHGKISVVDIATSFTFSLYLILAFGCMEYMVMKYNEYYLWFLIFLCAWSSDTFAFFTGKLFGKHKLIPDVSPKKTVEGSIGGIVFGTAAVVLYSLFITLINPEADLLGSKLPIMLAAGMFMSVLSQVGDLMMSVIKRHYGIKDYGKILPGHGGILDRFDSVLPAAIVLAVFVSFVL